MADDDVVAVEHRALAATREKFVEQHGRELRARQAQPVEFLRVDEAPRAVVAEDERVFLHDLGTNAFLRKRELVADQLEHERIRRQRKHCHHHAAFAVGVHEFLVAMRPEVAEEVAVTFGLALLGATEHCVELVDRLVRQDRAQEDHGVADSRQVGLEVAARVAEYLGDVRAFGQHGIHAQQAALVD